MVVSIDELLPEINILTSQATNDSQHPADSISRIPSLAFRLLKILYEDHLCGVKTERSVKELARRFDCARETISRAFSYLKEIGFVGFMRRGRDAAKRWITLCGFSWLDNQTSHQMSHQNQPIPYIYLSKREEKDINIIKQDEFCGKVEEELTPEDEILRLDIPHRHKEKILTRIAKTFIGKNRLKSLTSRVVASVKEKRIQSILGYFSTAISNEEKQVIELRTLLWKKGVKEGFKPYA